MFQLCYHNGHLLPLDQVSVSPMDRGYNFGDGIYEVVRVYGGRPFALEEHLDRLFRCAAAIQMKPRLDRRQYEELIHALITKSKIHDGMVYGQVTRGVQPRLHAWKPDLVPVDFWSVKELPVEREAKFETGIRLLSMPDDRWQHCDIKSICLLPNVMATSRALSSGFGEALYFLPETKVVTEGASANAFAVMDGIVYTHPIGPKVLPGITRLLLLEVARDLGVEVVEKGRDLGFFVDADEVFISSTTREAMPVTHIDGEKIGNGLPGPVTRRLQEGLVARIEALAAQPV